jgi:hypothetical protein
MNNIIHGELLFIFHNNKRYDRYYIHSDSEKNISPVKKNENEFRGWHGMLPVGSTYGYLLTGACIERTFNGRYLFVDTRILTPNSREHHPFPRIHHTSTMASATPHPPISKDSTMAIQWFFQHQLSLYPLPMLLRPWLVCYTAWGRARVMMPHATTTII